MFNKCPVRLVEYTVDKDYRNNDDKGKKHKTVAFSCNKGLKKPRTKCLKIAGIIILNNFWRLFNAFFPVVVKNHFFF